MIVQSAQNLQVLPSPTLTYNRDAWVKLNHLLSDYSEAEALLLCQVDSNTWVAWVPGYGEALLHGEDLCN